jgi:hypothetical protein
VEGEPGWGGGDSGVGGGAGPAEVLGVLGESVVDGSEFEVEEGLPPFAGVEGGGLEAAVEEGAWRSAVHAGAEAVTVMGAAEGAGEGIWGGWHDDQAGFSGEEAVPEEVHALFPAAIGDELKVEFAFAVDAEQDRVGR